MPNINSPGYRPDPRVKAGDIVLGNSKDNIYQTDIFEVEKVEWEERYWRVTTTSGSSFADIACRLATTKDLEEEIHRIRFAITDLAERQIQLDTYKKKLPENT